MDYKLLHVCFRVENLEKSVEFYEKALGYKEVTRKDFPEYEFTLVYMQDPASKIEIELTYNYGHGPYEIGDGYSHFAVHTDDLMKSYEKHKEMGIPCDDISGLPGGETRFYFMQDPDGYQIEIIGPVL